MQRARVAIPATSAYRPHIVDVGGRRGEVAKNVLTGSGAPAVMEVTAAPALAVAPRGPARHVGPIHAVAETIPRVGAGKATRRPVEVATKRAVPEPPRVVAPRPVARLQTPPAAGPRAPAG